jgi:hypothetical protein
MIAKSVLHDTIFERMEGDDQQSASGLQAIYKRLHRLLQMQKLLIDCNSQRLKRSRCAVDPAMHFARYGSMN